MVGTQFHDHFVQRDGFLRALQAAKQVLLSIDGIVESSLMNDVLLKSLNCHDDTDLVEKIAGKKATYYAQLANLVFDAAEQGDDVALAIVKEGAEYINNMARTLLAKKPNRLSMIGGLTSRLKPWLAQEIQAQLSEPLSPPEVGAVFFARRECAK